VLRQGKRLGVAEGEVTQNGELVAKAIVQVRARRPDAYELTTRSASSAAGSSGRTGACPCPTHSTSSV
jgi:hypothetical protein